MNKKLKNKKSKPKAGTVVQTKSKGKDLYLKSSYLYLSYCHFYGEEIANEKIRTLNQEISPDQEIETAMINAASKNPRMFVKAPDPAVSKIGVKALSRIIGMSMVLGK